MQKKSCSAWRTISVHFHFLLRCVSAIIALGWVNLSNTQAQTTNYALGTTALLVGPAAGSNSVVLSVSPQSAPWTGSANTDWLHLSTANQNGAGSTNVVFSYDANPGQTRSGTLTIARQTLSITQAGSAYIAAGPVTLLSAGLNGPEGVAVDGGGNVYIADANNNAIKKWIPVNNIVTTLAASGLNSPQGISVSGAGNVYIADCGDNAVKEWTAANSNLITLVSSGLKGPVGVAVDGAGNVYIADTQNNAIKKWTVANSNVTTLVSTGITAPFGVAVDGAGNVYINDTDAGNIKEWMAANGNVITLGNTLICLDYGMAVDGAGNAYLAGDSPGAVGTLLKWTAANNTITTQALRGLGIQDFVTADSAGDVYIADTLNNAIKELPNAFIDPTPKLESMAASRDNLPVVLPATANLLAPLNPTSDQAWLTITGVSNGVVNFAFTATTSNRTANITLLGQNIPVTQGGPSYSFAASTILVGPGAGSNSILLSVAPNFAPWTATANAAWLHLSPANQSGTGSTNLIFSFDANPGATRTGAVTIASQTLTVTQAGSTYIAAQPVTSLASAGLGRPSGVAVDRAGNVYIADAGNAAIKMWNATNNSVTTLVSSGLNEPVGVAVDGAGNVYIADISNKVVKEWMASNSNVITLACPGLSKPSGVAVDDAGNVYIADAGNNTIKEMAALTSSVSTLVCSGLREPGGPAVDTTGHIYIPDSDNDAFKEYTAGSGSVKTLVSSGLITPCSVAVDISGDVYIADDSANTIKEWTAASTTMTTKACQNLGSPYGVAVDGTGNVYFVTRASTLEELPNAFVDPTAKLEPAGAGSDVLPTVLPSTQNLLTPFAPSSDQAWLTITGVTNGVVTFSFTLNSGTNRTAHITLLGQSIAITQAGPWVAPPLLTDARMLGNGVCQFCFSNSASVSFTVLSTTNLSLPLSNWTVAGSATNIAAGLFQFTSQPATNASKSFYILHSP